MIIKKIKSYILMFSERRKINLKGTLINSFSVNGTIFIHIPKTAGVSIIHALYGKVSMESHRSIFFYKQVFKNSYKDFFKFSFVRNPYDRLFSAYKFLCSGGMNIHDKQAYEIHLSQYKDFEDFVLNGLTHDIVYKIIHFIPQSDFICSDKDEIMVDFLGRFETLELDLQNLEQLMSKKIKLPHFNKSKNIDYVNIYNDSMIRKVRDIYKRDIDIFGYNFK